MKIICDSCGTKYSISDDKVRGKVFKIRCKKCSHIIVVRGGEGGGGAESAATLTPMPDGWHVVVDGEQVGPLGEGEVRTRIERGEIKADTYVWKEGFADWVKLSSVPELASLVSVPEGESAGNAGGLVSAAVAAPVSANGTDRARRPSGAAASLFGAGSGAVAAGEDVDVFGSAAAASAARATGGDLFASPAVPVPSPDETRWPGSGASGPNHDGGRIETLTGQRHENSVLFSLSNLQSLAMTSTAAKQSGTPGAAPPVAEGSGLIDIRAMAATTLGVSGDGKSGKGDDLPAFAAFSPAAPVLLPLPSSSGPPKWVYAAIGLSLLLVIGLIYAAVQVFSAKPPSVAETVAAPAAPSPAAPAAAGSGPAAAGKAAEPSKPSTIPDDKLPPREGAAKVEGKPEGKPEAKADAKPEHHPGKGKGLKGFRGGEEGQPAGKKAAQVAAAEPIVPKPAKGSIDDLLDNAVTKKPAARARDDDSKKAGGGESLGPPSRTAITNGMNAVRPRVLECYKQYKVPGLAMVNVVIGRSGKVTSASITGNFAGTPTGACVEKAVKTASFPPSDGLTTPYPFQLK